MSIEVIDIMTQRCIYALRAVFELASRSNSEPIKIQEIAEAQQIPVKFLEVILNELRHGGFVESRRGNEGGYLLARNPRELSVGEVIEFVEGPVDALFRVKNSGLSPGCSFAIDKLWNTVAGKIKSVYETTTFSDLVEWERLAKNEEMVNYVI